MAARTSMAELIARLRKLIGDEDASPVLADELLQEKLDRHRTEWRYALLEARETRQPGGSVVYLEHVACRGDWEANEKLFDSSYNELTIASGNADRINGRWTLSASCVSVMILGYAYDIYAAAADALEAWAALLKLEVDFSISGKTFRDSQQFKDLLELAKEYRSQARAATGSYSSSEWNPYV